MERLRGGRHRHRPVPTSLGLHLPLDNGRLLWVRRRLPDHGFHLVSTSSYQNELGCYLELILAIF